MAGRGGWMGRLWGLVKLGWGGDRGGGGGGGGGGGEQGEGGEGGLGGLGAGLGFCVGGGRGWVGGGGRGGGFVGGAGMIYGVRRCGVRSVGWWWEINVVMVG